MRPAIIDCVERALAATGNKSSAAAVAALKSVNGGNQGIFHTALVGANQSR